MGILDGFDGSLVQFWYSPAKSEERQLEIPSQAEFQDKTPPTPQEKSSPFDLGSELHVHFSNLKNFLKFLKKSQSYIYNRFPMKTRPPLFLKGTHIKF